jgi:hypothetical protein
MCRHYAIIASLVLCSAAIGQEGTGNKRSGERLISVGSGKDSTGIVSYGLFCSVTRNVPEYKNLMLVLRNVGAKNVPLKNVTASDFRLQDKDGKSIKVFLRNAPQTMAIGDVTIAHILVAATSPAPQPWTLHFKSRPEALAAFELTIPDIAAVKE